MPTAVITGSTRGIGLGLAENFLRRGWNVVINGRSENNVQEVCSCLTALAAAQNLSASAAGKSGDVTQPQDMESLFDFTMQQFGAVDIWVNNAGVGHPLRNVWELDEETIRKVIEIDFTGTILAARVAVSKMLEQGHGHIYNMEGFGSDGRIMAGLTVYGAAKRALRFWSRSLAEEVDGSGVKVSRISPGMVITEFLTRQYDDDPEGLERGKKTFNVLADKVETVTPWLVEKMISNDKNNALFSWLTFPKILFRFLTARIIKRDLFD